jgi:hypothetical protein
MTSTQNEHSRTLSKAAAISNLVVRTLSEYMSDNHIDPDIAVEVFVIAPQERER